MTDVPTDPERPPAEPDPGELTEAQKAEIDRRLVAHRANPQAAIPWEQVKAEALARLKAKSPDRS